ncbi:ABC transporter cdr4 protein [Lasiodiplodia theobromae]|uniref:ABC transporter cdr4 protein n=1 Tax=Lasiodiplodia theobromae TaxID=45133 RepID=UPI0015C408C1|nr:ABC transporter cdr4 protein [Lasiodiplodia theobromae]KAF4539390.1 ABC transporter cdr4 protein [Lasiodiplodia theobromae]
MSLGYATTAPTGIPFIFVAQSLLLVLTLLLMMGRGSLVSLHQQLCLRFENITQRSAVNISSEQLGKLDDSFSRFKIWGERIGVGEGALDLLERFGNGYKSSIIKSFDGIYIKLRVIGNLMKEGETASSERDDEADATVNRITKDMESLEDQVADIQSFLERLSARDSIPELRKASSTLDPDGPQMRYVSNSTNLTTGTDSTGGSSAPVAPKTPRNNTIASPIDRKALRVPTDTTTTSSNKTRDASEWEEEWDREFRIATISATESHASFTMASDDENNGNDKSTAAFASRKAEKSSQGKDAARPHPANTTWMEDTSSTFKGEDSEELAKTKTRQPLASAERTSREQDDEIFRKHVSSRMRLLERQNRSLARKIGELQGGEVSEGDQKVIIERFVKTKEEEAARERLIREAAIEEYKEQLRVEKAKEQESRNMLLREARLIEDRAQRQMTDIYQQTGLQIREADQRHRDEVFQIQQQFTSELLVIERSIQEQISAKAVAYPSGDDGR